MRVLDCQILEMLITKIHELIRLKTARVFAPTKNAHLSLLRNCKTSSETLFALAFKSSLYLGIFIFYISSLFHISHFKSILPFYDLPSLLLSVYHLLGCLFQLLLLMPLLQLLSLNHLHLKQLLLYT